jgi:hypothetical protein
VVVLDGFRLLSACGVAFPDQAHAGDAAGLGVSSVAAEDLSFFPSLNTLDLGRNDLGDHAGALASLALLPSLRVLKLPCNGIRDPLAGFSPDPKGGSSLALGVAPVPRAWFGCLSVLDLSYNLVADPGAVAALGRCLPALRDLDLTCNGLVALPPPTAMAQFKCLTRLVLERNGLEDANGGGVWSPADEERAVVAGAMPDQSPGSTGGGRDTLGGSRGSSYVQPLPSTSALAGLLGGLGLGAVDAGSLASGLGQRSASSPGGRRDPHSPKEPKERRWSTLACLAACPALEDLQLGHNYLTQLPPSSCGHGAAGSSAPGHSQAPAFFPRLEALGLAFNYVSNEGSLAAAALLGRLRTLVLYGNPLLGPSLEDPTGDSVSELAAAVFHARDGTSVVPLDVLTEVPRRKGGRNAPLPDPSRRAAAMARRSTYRNVTLRPSDTDEGRPLPSAAAFRAAGHALTVATNGAPGAMPLHPKPPNRRHLAKLQKQQQRILGKGGSDSEGSDDGDRSWERTEDGGSATGTFLTGVDPYDKPYGSGGVAGKGGGENGRSARKHPEDKQQPVQRGPEGLVLDNPHGAAYAMPPAIFASALAKEVAPDQAKLRGALAGLRATLRAAEVTSGGDEAFLLAKTSEDPGERQAALGMRRLGRPTAAAKAKTLPRRLGPGGLFEAPPLAAEMGPGRAVGGGRGAPHDVSFKAVLGRQDAAARMLGSIEADLDAIVSRRGAF